MLGHYERVFEIVFLVFDNRPLLLWCPGWSGSRCWVRDSRTIWIVPFREFIGFEGPEERICFCFTVCRIHCTRSQLSNHPELFFRTPNHYLILLHHAHKINHTRCIILQLQLPLTRGYRDSSLGCFDTLFVPNDADVCALCLLFACSFRRHCIV